MATDDAHENASTARFPPEMLFDHTATHWMSNNDGAGTRERAARRKGIEEKIAAGIQIARDAAESFAEIRPAKKVIHRVKICRDQIHGTRQPETPHVLLQQANRGTTTNPLSDAEHVWRAVNGKHWNSPVLAQIARKQSRATADVRG